MRLTDTHCHLNDSAFDADRDEVWARAREAGVTQAVCIGADLSGSASAVRLAERWEGVFAAIGIHPEAAEGWDDAARAELARLLAESRRVVAFGEIGLDYHWDTVPRARQQAVFAEQIAFAASLAPGLPLVIHCRDAQDDVLRLLRESGTTAPVVMHCFTGDIEAARALLDAGCFLGIGGVATFKRSEALRAAVAAAPLDRLLLETDCPYLAPQQWRGRRNEPSYLVSVAATVAAVKGISVEAVAERTTENAARLFGL